MCHVISGATVWAGLSIPTNAALIYSIGYNATYMIPETIVTAVVAYYIGSMLDLKSDNITQLRRSEDNHTPVLKWVGGLLLAGALVFDVRTVFSNIQNADSGEFDVTGFANVNWVIIAVISIIAIIVAFILFTLSSRKKAQNE